MLIRHGCLHACAVCVCHVHSPVPLFSHLVHEFDGREAPALGLTHKVRVSPAIGPQQVDVNRHVPGRLSVLG